MKLTVTEYIAVVAALLLLLPAISRADDYGPHPDLRAIRHDLPIIEAMAPALKAAEVIVEGNEALAYEASGRIWVLRRRYDRWWLEDWIDVSFNGSAWHNADCNEGGPTVAFLEHSGVTVGLANEAAQHLSVVKQAQLFQSPRRATTDLTPVQQNAPLGGGGSRNCVRFGGPVGLPDSLYSGAGFQDRTDHYRLTIFFGTMDAPPNADLTQLRGRMPTEAESWMTRGGNSYYFFSADIRSEAPIHVKSGTTIDVHFPFALPPEKKYSLTIGFADEPIGPIVGTLKDNTLHFVLPAFSVQPGAHLMGEIEGDPPGF